MVMVMATQRLVGAEGAGASVVVEGIVLPVRAGDVVNNRTEAKRRVEPCIVTYSNYDLVPKRVSDGYTLHRELTNLSHHAPHLVPGRPGR